MAKNDLDNARGWFSAMRGKLVKRMGQVTIPCLLVVSSVASTYCLLELTFTHMLHLLPLKTHVDLDKGIRVLAQYSKRRTVPEQYIALVGDSYAVGLGDWFLDANKNKRPAFHDAHVIYARTGRDVITFGATDNGSLGGLVAGPISQYEFINASARFDMDPPRFIIVHFL